MTPAKTWVNKPTDTNRQTDIEFHYEARPSWKSYGTGRRHGRIQAQKDGSLYCIFSEHSESGHGKEVFIAIPAEVVAMIKAGKFDWKEAA